MKDKTVIKWIAALIVPAGISGAWLTARVVSAIGALGFVIQMAVGREVLMALAGALGIVFAHAADAQGVSGFVYARDRYGSDRLVLHQAYEDLNRFGRDLYYLGRGYDGGVRAVLYDSRTQVFITYAFTADSQNTGKDLVKATLQAKNYNPNMPPITSVFVAGYGGSMIGALSGSMFGLAYSSGGTAYASPVKQY
jgi:hypothetical protein